MTCNRRIAQISTHILLPILLIFSLISIACAADEMPRESAFIGTWNGIITTAEQGKNPVDLTVAAAEGNSSSISYSFHYGPPRSCRLNAVKTAQENNILYLVFDEASGGFCDKLWKGSMSLELFDEKRMGVKIQKPAINLVELAVLTKKD